MVARHANRPTAQPRPRALLGKGAFGRSGGSVLNHKATWLWRKTQDLGLRAGFSAPPRFTRASILGPLVLSHKRCLRQGDGDEDRDLRAKAVPRGAGPVPIHAVEVELAPGPLPPAKRGPGEMANQGNCTPPNATRRPGESWEKNWEIKETRRKLSCGFRRMAGKARAIRKKGRHTLPGCSVGIHKLSFRMKPFKSIREVTRSMACARRHLAMVELSSHCSAP